MSCIRNLPDKNNEQGSHIHPGIDAAMNPLNVNLRGLTPFTHGADAVGQFEGLSIDNTLKILWEAP